MDTMEQLYVLDRLEWEKLILLIAWWNKLGNKYLMKLRQKMMLIIYSKSKLEDLKYLKSKSMILWI